jgi:hypothetical protein
MATDIVKSAAKKARPHTIYKTKSGKRVPGVTTITGVMDKPALVYWANNLGIEGIKVRDYVDALADAGTLAHAMVQWHLQGVEPNQDILNQYSKDTIDLAETSAIKFFYWQESVGYEPILVEEQMVSEKHEYGGTIDGLGVCKKVRGEPRILLDLKTSKAIYDDMFTQVAGGYGIMARENGHDFEYAVIVRIGRSLEEGSEAEARRCPCQELHEQRFLTCRELYRLNNEISKASK